jgi:hypothetical protein
MIADHETALIGPITDRIIDADAMVRSEHGEKYPAFAIYRLILCGDRLHLTRVRQWWVSFCIQWVADNYRKKFSDEVVCVAAWDSLARVMQQGEAEEFVEVYNEFLDRMETVRVYREPVLTDEFAAGSLEMRVETYSMMRKALQTILTKWLHQYWLDLLAAYARVIAAERRDLVRLQ